jgi:plastocyanin
MPLRLEDHALIGDVQTTALVAFDGAVGAGCVRAARGLAGSRTGTWGSQREPARKVVIVMHRFVAAGRPGSGTDGQPGRPSTADHRYPRLAVAAVSLGVLVNALTACGGPGEIARVGVAPNTILIDNFSFAPDGVVVAPGSKITVVNRGTTTHTVTAVDKLFDSGAVPPGRSVTITAPSTPGKYRYVCMIHEYLTGFVTVTGPNSPASPSR